MSFSHDDCDQTRVMKLKCVTANPTVQTHKFVASVLRDPGHSVENTAEATWQGLIQACHVKVGPLCKDDLTSPESHIDRDLVRHAQQVMVCAASDG